jgi:hypothetical protein
MAQWSSIALVGRPWSRHFLCLTRWGNHGVDDKVAERWLDWERGGIKVAPSSVMLWGLKCSDFRSDECSLEPVQIHSQSATRTLWVIDPAEHSVEWLEYALGAARSFHFIPDVNENRFASFYTFLWIASRKLHALYEIPNLIVWKHVWKHFN